MSAKLHERVRQIRQRVMIRSWEYRQRNHSHGVWYRLRRVLAGSRSVLVIDEQDAQRLLGSGHEPLPVGHQLHPARQLFIISEHEASGLSSAREIPVRLSAELLAAPYLALIPFADRS
jgi:hypothetical protein